MKKLLIATLAGMMLALPLSGMSAPDESQKQLIQRTIDAKKKLAAAQAAKGPERQKMMQEHMQMMQDMMAQMRKAKMRDGMTPQQMKEWIDEHMKIMDQMMSQMMDQHHMMMQGKDMKAMEMKGMDMKGMGK